MRNINVPIFIMTKNATKSFSSPHSKIYILKMVFTNASFKTTLSPLTVVYPRVVSVCTSSRIIIKHAI